LITCGGTVLIIFICVVCVLSETGNPLPVRQEILQTIWVENAPDILREKKSVLGWKGWKASN